MKNNLRIHSLLLFCAACFFSSCNEPAKPDRIPGVYHANYGAIEETIEMHPDGTFDQTISGMAKPLQNHGNWKLVEDNQVLEFDHIYALFDIDGKLLQEPNLTSGLRGVWVDDSSNRRIAFDINHDYVLDRKEK